MMNKPTILLLAVVSFSATPALPQSNEAKVAPPTVSPQPVSPEKAKADAAWKKLGTTTQAGEPIDGVTTYAEAGKKWTSADKSLYYAWIEKLRVRYRQEGLKFWREFPNDNRRYIWLLETVWAPPKYWKDVERATSSIDYENPPIDQTARKAWDDIYPTLRADYMASSSWGSTPKWRGHLQYEELFNDAWGVKKLSAPRADKAHLLSQYVTRFFDLEQNAEVRDSDLRIVASTLFDVIGDDPSAESAFVEALKLSKRSDVQLYGYGREQIARLRSNPFGLQTASITGENIDVAKLRGKVVLVDIWSNWCSGCIAAMPKVQGIWEKYRDRGFEVVGVWLTTDEAKEKEQAQKYLSEKGAKYPNAVIAGQANIDFCKKYSIIGVPVTFLLGRDGKLVTNDVTGSRLEEEVKRLVEAPTKK